ncbi:MAG: hypothetical protein OXO52_15050 [Rhodospirillales bacterium]|nr:hypothetical protein [Rhodospirillales bacterium]MDE0381789.1 hypothetical protein [Rhodospirillales bacterium]
MANRSKIAAAGVALAAVGLIAAACQTQQAPSPEVTAETVQALTVAEVQELVTGNTVIGVDEKRNITAAEYFASDGTAKLKAKTPFGTFNYEGTYFFNDLGHFCTNYPAIPIGPKEFCKYVTPLGGGRYEQTDGIILEQVLEGEQLDQLE